MAGHILRRFYGLAFFSPASWAVFVFRLAVKPPHLLLTEREYEDKENSLKVNQRPELFGMDLLGIVTPSMEVYASTFNDSKSWTCARLQSMGKCGLLRRLSLFRPSSCESYDWNANPVKMMEAVGFGPTLGISPIRLPQIPFPFGFMLP